MKKQKWNWRYC